MPKPGRIWTLTVDRQLSLDLGEPKPPNPNAWMFHPDGRPRRLLWCSDSVRMAHDAGEAVRCPYEGRKVPCGECCLEICHDAAARGAVLERDKLR